MGSLESKMFEAKKESEALIDRINYEVVAGGFHQGAISCMDICI